VTSSYSFIAEDFLERNVILRSHDQVPSRLKDEIYVAEMRKRMPALKHVELILRVDNQQVYVARIVQLVASTKFTRACWKMGLLKVFAQPLEYRYSNTSSKWREEVKLGCYSTSWNPDWDE
jgi:hypothetical protein